MANYIEKADFYSFITEKNLDGITDGDDSIYESELLSSLEITASYLRFRYDTDAEFAKIATERNPAIVQIVVVLVLYNIYSRLNGSEIPNWIQVLYDGGDSQQRGGKLGYLKEIRKGDVQINLALLPEVEDGSTQSGNSFAYGNAAPVINRNTSI